MLAEELPKLANAVGGSEYVYHLLAPLESIVAVEEATVREKVLYLVGAFFFCYPRLCPLAL